MAIIDRIKFDAPSDEVFAWKWQAPNGNSEGIRLGAQLIVNQSQEAVFVKGGQALDVFGPGTHTLSSGNLPLLARVVNMPFGGKTPFAAEVWYVNRHAKRDLGWGTPGPIQIMDPSYGFPVTVRGFGKWGLRIQDSRSFVTQLVGTLRTAESDRIEEYFVGEIVHRFSDALAKCLVEQKVSVFEAATKLNDLSRFTHDAIAKEFARFGIEIVNFNVQRVSIPDEEVAKFQEAFGEKLRANAIGSANMQAYQMMRSFDTMEKAASNESGAAGGLLAGGLGLGLGVGAGMPVGQKIGQMINPSPEAQQPAAAPAPASEDPMGKLQKLKQMLDAGLISQDDFDAKKKDILSSM